MHGEIRFFNEDVLPQNINSILKVFKSFILIHCSGFRKNEGVQKILNCITNVMIIISEEELNNFSNELKLVFEAVNPSGNNFERESRIDFLGVPNLFLRDS